MSNFIIFRNECNHIFDFKEWLVALHFVSWYHEVATHFSVHSEDMNYGF